MLIPDAYTRRHLGGLLTDIGTAITEMTNEQVIGRIALLQELYRIRSTFMINHHEAMLTQQRSQMIAQATLDASRMTEAQKHAHHLWQQAVVLLRRATSPEDFEELWVLLQESQRLEPISPAPWITAGSADATLGHPELAAAAFSEADHLLEANPFLSSFNLLSLSEVLMRVGRYDHAEHVMAKAVRLDPSNPEVHYGFAKAAWKSGDHNVAMRVLMPLLRKNNRYYKAQLACDPCFSDLFKMLVSQDQ